jgi:hypothetical protein
MVDKQKVVELFRQSGAAHSQAFQAVNGEDPEWPMWYAEYLHAGLQLELGVEFTRSELIYLLVRADKEYRQNSPAVEWPEYYADLFQVELIGS